MALPVVGAGPGGGGIGGVGGPGTQVSYSDDGSTSVAFPSSNYVETFDSNGDLCCQMFGSDSDGYSFDIVNPDGSQFSMDMPEYPSDFDGQNYTIAVAGGSITIDFSMTLSSAVTFFLNPGGGVFGSPPVSATPTTTTVGDFDFDGTGQSYACQRARLWQATIIAAIIVAGGTSMRAGPVIATGAAIGTTVAAVAAINNARAYLNSIGCPTR